MTERAKNKGQQFFVQMVMPGSEALISAWLSIIFYAFSIKILGPLAMVKTVASLLLSFGSLCGQVWKCVQLTFNLRPAILADDDQGRGERAALAHPYKMHGFFLAGYVSFLMVWPADLRLSAKGAREKRASHST